MEFDSLTKQQKNGLRETVIRKTHQQGRAILQPCKFFKVFNYMIFYIDKNVIIIIALSESENVTDAL